MKGWIGIALAVVAGVLLGVPPDTGQEAPRAANAVVAKTDTAAKQNDTGAAKAKTEAAPSATVSGKQGDTQVSADTQKTPSRFLWIFLALLVLLAWGVQGFAISHANRSMKAESIFFYMMLTSILLIPVALAMTDFKKEINWSLNGPGLAAAIQILNSIGALLLVYAFRYGKAIIVSPLTNAGGPVVTVAISLMMAWYAKELVWNAAKTVNSVGIVLAVAATVLMAIEGEKA